MNPNLFDIVVFVILMGFMLLSYVRGAFREVLSLVGLVIGWWAGMTYRVEMGSYLVPIVQDARLAEILTFVMALVAGYLLGTFLSGLGEGRPRGLMNNIIGGVIGVAKGLVVSVSLYWVVEAYIPPFQPELAASRTGPFLGQLLGMFAGLTL